MTWVRHASELPARGRTTRRRRSARVVRGWFGALDRDRVERPLQQLVVVAVRAVVSEPIGTPRASTRSEASPPLGPVSGIRTRLWRAERCFAHRPISRQPGPVDTDLLVVVEQTLTPDLVENARLLPLLKAPVRRRGIAHPGRVQRVPLHPRTQHQQNRVHHPALRQTPTVSSQRMLRRRRQQRLDSLPQPVRHTPTIITVDQTHPQPPMSDQQISTRVRRQPATILPTGTGPKDVEEEEAGVCVEVSEAGLGEEPAGCPRDPGCASDERTAPVTTGAGGELSGERAQELGGAGVGGREEQQGGEEWVVASPCVAGGVGGV